MNKQEFCDRTNAKYETLDEQNWDIISTVYTYHPAISNVKGKDQIAALYNKHGMVVIEDMYERAYKICQQESQIQATKVSMERAEKQFDQEMADLKAVHEDRMADMRQTILDALKVVDALEGKNDR